MTSEGWRSYSSSHIKACCCPSVKAYLVRALRASYPSFGNILLTLLVPFSLSCTFPCYSRTLFQAFFPCIFWYVAHLPRVLLCLLLMPKSIWLLSPPLPVWISCRFSLFTGFPSQVWVPSHWGHFHRLLERSPLCFLLTLSADMFLFSWVLSILKNSLQALPMEPSTASMTLTYSFTGSSRLFSISAVPELIPFFNYQMHESNFRNKMVLQFAL